MSRYIPDRDPAPVFAVAKEWKHRCLLNGGSIFTGSNIWQPEYFQELMTRFVEQPDTGEGSFLDKLAGQLQGASSQACLLAGEIFYLMLLCPSNISAQVKRKNLKQIWDLAGTEFPVDHPWLSVEVLAGFGSAGTGYNNHRPREMAYAIRVFSALLELDGLDRATVLRSGDQLAKWLERVPENEQRQFRHMLLYLLFPDDFERIFGGTDRIAVASAFAGKPTAGLRRMSAHEVDQLLSEIRAEQLAKAGVDQMDFYEPGFRELWGEPEPNFWLLPWRPTKFPWAAQAALREQLYRDDEVTIAWPCEDDRISVGDTVFIVRLGSEPEGVVARGNVTSSLYEDRHWEDERAESDDKARFIDIQLRALRDPGVEAYISRRDLEAIRVDGQNWTPKATAEPIAARSAKVLTGLWEKLPEPRKSGTPSKKTVPPVAEAKNIILYGPPGTGKTYEMERIQSRYEVKTSRLSNDQWLTSNLEDVSWWQVVLMALVDLGARAPVSDILMHEYFQAKARLLNRKPENLRATCWAALQSHAVTDSKTVQFDVDSRRAPHVFDKSADGIWFLTNDWRESAAEWVDRHERIRQGPKTELDKVRRYEWVTFHQSYSYEDFVEGIRPETSEDEAGMTYLVKPGVFKRLCNRAKADPTHRYALFIDEINRGNVARIFGELITLIEPGKRAVHGDQGALLAGIEVTLPYSGDRFSVPRNLDIYGAMNTADRSVAPLDAALRRRFQFIELLPNPERVAGERSDGYIADGEGGLINLRTLMRSINDRLECLVHRDQTVGHSYFMKVRDIHDLKRVLINEIIPQLQEYFYNDWRKIQLVFLDHLAAPELQIVRSRRRSGRELFGGEGAGMQDTYTYDVVSEDELTPDAIRKVYQPDS